MDNSQQIVNIQNQIDQEQTRHRNRMQALKKSLENARQANEKVLFYQRLYEKFDRKGMTTAQTTAQIIRCLDILMSEYGY